MILKSAGNKGDFGAVMTKYGEVLGKTSSASRMAEVSRRTGEAFSVVQPAYNYAALDTVIAVTNRHPTKELVIHSLYTYSDTASLINVHLTTRPTTPAGTALTAKPLNTRLNNTAAAALVEAYGDETGQATQGTIIRVAVIAAEGELNIDIPQDVVRLSYNTYFGVDFVTVGALAGATIMCYFDDKQEDVD
uniref:Uncharacterized protein n=1 Tax=viral metagenome TaxID=1070528 RepID=A0A6M3KYR7_9ZZZZ